MSQPPLAAPAQASSDSDPPAKSSDDEGCNATEGARLLLNAGLRCTRQRLAVYAALRATTLHPTADELHRAVLPLLPRVSLATVYNTLEAFCQAGIAQKLPPSPTRGTTGTAGPGSARFDATHHNHLHLRLPESGELRDVPDRLGRLILDSIPADAIRRIERELGCRITKVQIELVAEAEAGSGAA